MPASPELTSAPAPEKDATPDELRGLTPDAIEAFRLAEKQAVLDAVSGVTDPAERIRLENQTMAEVAMSHPEYLAKHGVAVDNPHYSDYLGYLGEYSFRAMPDSVWYSGLEHGQTIKPGGPEPVSGRSRAEETFNQFRTELTGPSVAATETTPAVAETAPAAANTDPAATPPTAETKPAATAEHKPLLDRIYDELEGNTNGDTLVFRTALESLKTQRAELAAMAAKEAAKPFSLRRKRFEAARAAYDAKVINVGQHVDQYLSKQRAKDGGEARTLDERRADALYYLVGEQNRLREMSREEFQGTRTSAFINWFREGSVLKRVGKGALVAAPIAAIGLLTAPVTAVGAGVLAGGLGAARFLRGAAASDNRKNAFKELSDDERRTLARTMMLEIEPDKFAPKRGNEDLHRASFSAAANEAGSQFDRMKTKEQKQRRKAVAWGLGSVAAGSAAPWLLGELAERLSDANVRGPSSIRPGVESPGVDADAPAVTSPADTDPKTGLDNLGPGIDTEPATPQYEFSSAAQTVSGGEGLYQTFNELNLPLDQAEKHEFLHLVGPKLVEMGLAYPAPELGGYGLNMTPDGRMPEEALRYMTDVAREHGYLPDVAEAAADTIGDTAGEPVTDAKPGFTSDFKGIGNAIENAIDKGLISFDEQTGLSELVTDRADDFQRLENTFPDVTGPEQIAESTIPAGVPIAAGAILGAPIAAGAFNANRREASAQTLKTLEPSSPASQQLLARSGINLTSEQLSTAIKNLPEGLARIRFDNNSPVAEKDNAGKWRVNLSPKGELHPAFKRYLVQAEGRS